MKRIYLDNNATTPVAPEVRAAMLPCLEEIFGNPSSGHRHGEQAGLKLETARSQVAGLLNCALDRIVFTSGGTEANNLAIWSAAAAHPEKKHLISSMVEHASVLTPLRYLARRGYEVELLPVDAQGRLDPERLSAAVRDDTALVSLMAANNETGVMFPVEEIGKLCRSRSVLFHCDGVQMLGKLPLDLASLPVDYLAMAAHKLHGPKGSGGLFARRGAPLAAMVMGADQENGHRAGTENVPGIVGFGAACELAGEFLPVAPADMNTLRERLEEGILAAVKGARINGREAERLPNTVNVSFRDCAASAIIQELDERGVAISAHSACQSGDLDPSHVLAALAVPENYRHGTLRISLSRYNTMEEIDTLLAVLPRLVEKSRQGFTA